MLNINQLIEEYYPFLMDLFDKWNSPEDLRQMVFLDLLEYKNVDKLNEMHNKNELRYWLARMVKNYQFSTNSRYYNLYVKPTKNFVDIDTLFDDSDDEWD